MCYAIYWCYETLLFKKLGESRWPTFWLLFEQISTILLDLYPLIWRQIDQSKIIWSGYIRVGQIKWFGSCEVGEFFLLIDVIHSLIILSSLNELAVKRTHIRRLLIQMVRKSRYQDGISDFSSCDVKPSKMKIVLCAMRLQFISVLLILFYGQARIKMVGWSVTG